MTALEKLIEVIEQDIKTCTDSGVNVLFVAALSSCLERVKPLLPEERKMLDAAREDEAGKWEAQLKAERERAGKLVEALEELVKWCTPDDRWNYMAALENAQRLINEYNNKS